MKKNFFKFLLLGAFTLSLGAGFVGCKDYDDDVNRLDGDLTALSQKVTQLQSDLATATGNLATMKTELEGKITAAQAAAATDAQAKATAAAATAKREAIEEAENQIAALKTELSAAIEAAKYDDTALTARVKALEDEMAAMGGLLDAINGALGEEMQFESIDKAVEALVSVLTDLNGDVAANQVAIESVKAQVDLQTAALEKYGFVNGDDKADIEELLKELVRIRDLVDGGLTEDIEARLATAEAAIEALKADIVAVNADLVTLSGKINKIFAKRLTSLAFLPQYYVDGVEAIAFQTIFYEALPITGTAYEDEEIESNQKFNSYKFFTATNATAKYHLNPSSVNLETAATYAFVADQAVSIETRGIATPINIEKYEQDGDVAIFTVSKTEKFNETRNMKDIVALKATLVEGLTEQEIEDEAEVNVFSSYAHVYDMGIHAYQLAIADAEDLEEGNVAHFARTFTEATNEEARYTMAYNKDFDLGALIATCLREKGDHDPLDIEAFGLSYKFYVAVSDYKISAGGTTTNQQTYIECTDGLEGVYKAKGYNKESIGRTPIMRVDLVDGAGNVVIRGFVKVAIVAEKADNKMLIKTLDDLTFKCNATTAKYEMDEVYIRENLYRVLHDLSTDAEGISHEEFWTIYAVTGASVEKDGEAFTMPTPTVVDGPVEAGFATKKIVWNFVHGDLGAITATGASFKATLTLTNSLAASSYPEKVTFTFTLNAKLPEISELDLVKNEVYWKNDMFQSNVNVPKSVIDIASNCYFSTPLSYAWTSHEHGLDGEACYLSSYRIIKTIADGKETRDLLEGVYLEGNNIRLKKSGSGSSAVKEALNSAKGLQAVVEEIATLENGDIIVLHTFTVNFVRPVNLTMPLGLSVTDARDNGDVISFQADGLLTDWANKAIVAPEWTRVGYELGYWALDCQTPDVYVPEQTIVIPGHLEFQFETVTIPTGTSVTVWTATLNYKRTYQEYEQRGGGGGGGYQWVTKSTDNLSVDMDTPVGTEAEAEELAELLLPENTSWDRGGGPHGYYTKRYVYEIVNVEATPKTTETTDGGIEIKTIKNVITVPATVETIDGYWVSHDCNDKPRRPGAEYGDRNGCWVWSKFEFSLPSYEPGQYWLFYGRFGDVTLDLENVTTNLDYNGGKLPVGVTLTQSGNTLKYVNVQTPVSYSYEIYIPVSISYGWGIATSTLVITVNPA